MSTARGFLKPARRRRNLQVETKALTKWIITKEGRATGVRFRQDGFEREAHARCEVILSAGSIASPQILERSGIGDGERLKERGVEVVHALPGVGENLQDHYVARFCCHAKDVVTFNERARGIRPWLGSPAICIYAKGTAYDRARQRQRLHQGYAGRGDTGCATCIRTGQLRRGTARRLG